MPALPTIHLNGTSAETLRNEYGAASQAIAAAMEALQRCECNARDFYPQQDTTGAGTPFLMAQQERAEALRSLQSAYDYATAWEEQARAWLWQRDQARRKAAESGPTSDQHSQPSNVGSSANVG